MRRSARYELFRESLLVFSIGFLALFRRLFLHKHIGLNDAGCVQKRSNALCLDLSHGNILDIYDARKPCHLLKKDGRIVITAIYGNLNGDLLVIFLFLKRLCRLGFAVGRFLVRRLLFMWFLLRWFLIRWFLI